MEVLLLDIVKCVFELLEVKVGIFRSLKFLGESLVGSSCCSLVVEGLMMIDRQEVASEEAFLYLERGGESMNPHTSQPS